MDTIDMLLCGLCVYMDALVFEKGFTGMICLEFESLETWIYLTVILGARLGYHDL